MDSVSIGNPQSMNLYAYVENNPIDFVDPSGLNKANPYTIKTEYVTVRDRFQFDWDTMHNYYFGWADRGNIGGGGGDPGVSGGGGDAPSEPLATVTVTADPVTVEPPQQTRVVRRIGRRGRRSVTRGSTWEEGTGRARTRNSLSNSILVFRGLNANRPLSELTFNEVYNAFRNTPFTPYNHAINQMRENARTSALGIRTLNDYANSLNRALRNGNFEQSKVRGRILITHGRFWTVLDIATREIVTVRPIGRVRPPDF